MAPIPEHHPLRRWMTGLIETCFQTEIGICQPALTDYLADLLTEFTHVERINLLRDGSGRPVRELAEMFCDMESGPGITDHERRRLIHRHIGDFTLFWTGVYPENLHRLYRQHAQDALMGYLCQGRRSYGIASELSDDGTRPPAFVLRQLSEQFEDCVYGLTLVRRQWEHGPTSPIDEFPAP